MRKVERLVELDDILSSQFFGDSEPMVGLVLRTHLALEALLVELIGTIGSSGQAWKWNFPKKTQFLFDNGLISSSDKQAFDKYNDLRNDFAHVFAKSTELPEILTLARELENLGIEFSGSVGQYSEEQAAEYYGGMLGVAAEISWCILFHAAHILAAQGGRDIFAATSRPAPKHSDTGR